MRFNTILKVIGLLTVMLAFACSPKAAKQIPVEDFFKNPEKSSFQISPDGKHFSYMSQYEKRKNVFIQKVGCDSATRLTSETERDIAGSGWANNERVIYLKDSGGDENFRLYGVNIDGSNPLVYTPSGVKISIIDALPEIDSLMLISTNERDARIFDVYRLNLNTGKYEMIAKNPGHYQGYMTDHDGKLRIAYAIVDGVNTQILYRETEEEEFKPVITLNFKEGLHYMYFTPDNKNVYASSNLGRDKAALVIVDPRTGKEIDSLHSHPKYDLANIGYSDVKDKLTAAVYQGQQEVIRHYFDKDSEEVNNKLKAHFPKDLKIGTTSVTKDEKTRIIHTGNDKDLGSYHIYDVENDKVTKICDLAPWLNPKEMGTMHSVTYETRDGLTIEAYLTLPKGYNLDNAKNLPIVINPHGGPWVRDGWGYNPEVQFLANRGYGVLQMNYRGSTGFGKKFVQASYKQWGQNMQNDITDGVNWLIEKGIADPERIAIYGASYGGYATLAGVAFTPELYTCAVDYVGVSNLFTFMETFPPYWLPLREMMYEMVGDPVKDSLMLAKYSPALHADKIIVPLFIAQGANDPRVKKSESDQMVEALRARGIEVDYMVKDNEGHGFRNEENKFEFYGAMEAFLAKHLKPVK